MHSGHMLCDPLTKMKPDDGTIEALYDFLRDGYLRIKCDTTPYRKSLTKEKGELRPASAPPQEGNRFLQENDTEFDIPSKGPLRPRAVRKLP